LIKENSDMAFQLSQPIAYGRTAEIYAWEDNKILKLYYDWCPPDWVKHEAKIAYAVVEAGIPTPKAGEIMEINKRYGLVYERVDGVSMLTDMNSHPWKLVQYAHLLAELHWRIHQLKVPGLDSYRAGLSRAIQNTSQLSDSLREKALAALESLPEGDIVCHGDFHPHNVLMTSKGPLVIDWMTATTGNPWADVARTSLLITIGPKGAGKMVSRGVLLALHLYHNLYLSRYRSLLPDQERQFQRWLPVMAAARLNEDIQPEREYLLQIVQDAFD
jgi:uncharacterized protein (TIGR02172 family)